MGDVGSGMARTQSAWAGPERERERLELGLTVPEEAEACFALPLSTLKYGQIWRLFLSRIYREEFLAPKKWGITS